MGATDECGCLWGGVGVMWLSSLSSRSHGSWFGQNAHNFLQDPNFSLCRHTFALRYNFGCRSRLFYAFGVTQYWLSGYMMISPPICRLTDNITKPSNNPPLSTRNCSSVQWHCSTTHHGCEFWSRMLVIVLCSQVFRCQA